MSSVQLAKPDHLVALLQDVYVCGHASVCEWQDDGMCVFVSMCYSIGALRAELQPHI